MAIEPPRASEEEPTEPSALARTWADIVAAGWRDDVLRFASHALVLVLLGAVVWLGRVNLSFLDDLAAKASLNTALVAPTSAAAVSESFTVTVLAEPKVPSVLVSAPASLTLARRAQLHTLIPQRSRATVITYTVQAGDTLFGIADKFGVKPETILWGNYFTLKDDPHTLRPEQVLNILPVDGTYHFVTAGNTLEQIAKFYRVEPQTIMDWEPNGLTPENTALTPNTYLIIPDGQRESQQWVVPTITRDTRSSAANNFGQCAGPYSGAVGTGSFVWPADNHFLSGYDYNPPVHRGLDIKAKEGVPIYAADSGVIVYSGWNDYGYGNLVVIDHGNGWQTVYGHLSQIYVVCGQSVGQGVGIGLSGNTGRSSGAHLHFETRYNGSFVNPWNVLP